MKKWASIGLFLNLAISLNVFAQSKYVLVPHPGKLYLSKRMESLEILNDSTLTSSLWHSTPNSTYQIKDDTLLIKEAYKWYGPNGSQGSKVIFHPFKILMTNNDTIVIKNKFHGEPQLKPSDWEDLLVFIDIDKLKQPIRNFRFLKLRYSNVFDGSLEVNIDSTRKISYKKYPSPFQDSPKKIIKFSGYLSLSDFKIFKDVLALSLVNKLPVSRGCNIDEPQRDFTVLMNNKTFVSKGCTMYYPQYLLFNYLYRLNERKLIRNKPN